MASRGRSKQAARAQRARAPPARARSRPAADAVQPRRWDFDRLLSGPRLRALYERPTLSAALLLGLSVLAYLWPVLLAGKMLSPLAVIYDTTPWTHYAPSDVASYTNYLLVDIPLSHYPWNVYAREMLHAGTFPAWNPHVLAGVPFFANPQTLVLSPFSLPMWLLPLNYGLGVAAALKLWAAAFGTYLLVRELRLGFLAGLLAGVSYALCSFNVTWLAHETLPAVAAMLPWMLWLTERVLRSGRIGPALGLALVTGIAITGGHPGTQVHVLAATALYAVIRVAVVPDLQPADRLRRVAFVGGGVAFGVLLVAIIFVPELQSANGTIGTASRRGGNATQPGSNMPFSMIRTVLFPDWWGRPSSLYVDPANGPTTALGPGNLVELNYNERTFYGGLVALAFAAIALVTRGSWRRKAPIAAIGFVALAIPLHAPVLHWLAEHLPVLDVVQNQRMHFVFELAVAVLGAFGLQAVLERPAEDRWRLVVPGVLLFAALVAFGAIGPSGAEIGHVLRHFVTGKDFHNDHVLALTSVGWVVLLAVAVGAALLALQRWPHQGVAIGAAIVLIAAFDMLHFAHGYQPMGPASKVVVPRTPAIAYLQDRVDRGRFLGLGGALINDFSLVYGLDDVRGYDPPQPTQRYFRLWKVINPEQTDWQSLEVEGLGENTVRVASVLGVRYFVTDPGTGPPKLGGRTLRPLTRVYSGKDAAILENPNAVPRAMVAPGVRLTANESDTRAAIVGEGFDPRARVVVERSEPGASALANAPPARGTAVIAHEENSSVTLNATLDRRGLVVLSDHLADGWSVRVDGRAATQLRVNDVMRGVVVGPGHHEITWSYTVPGLRLGIALSLLSLVTLLAGAAVLVVRARRGRDAA